MAGTFNKEAEDTWRTRGTGPVSEKRTKANRPRLEFIYRVAHAGKSHGEDDGDIDRGTAMREKGRDRRQVSHAGSSRR